MEKESANKNDEKIERQKDFDKKKKNSGGYNKHYKWTNFDLI